VHQSASECSLTAYQTRCTSPKSAHLHRSYVRVSADGARVGDRAQSCHFTFVTGAGRPSVFADPSDHASKPLSNGRCFLQIA
jgi:hypothetical protein